MFDSVEAFYRDQLTQPRAITAHLPRLLDLASLCDTVVEFGVKKGASSSALILGAREKVSSWDIFATSAAMVLKRLAGAKWDYTIDDSRLAQFTQCDLLFIDSLHTYDHLSYELLAHAHKAKRFLVFHDTITFGSIGANGETGRWSWEPVLGQSVPSQHLGIRPAIDNLMMQDRSWAIRDHFTDSHGLLVLERR